MYSSLTSHPRGREGDEVDESIYNMAKPRRRSNSFVAERANTFKTKFDVNEPEPVFEETIHGATAEDYIDEEMEGHNELEKHSTTSSIDSLTALEMGEEEEARKM